MSGLEARYYFAINFILYRTVSQRQRDLSFWHLSASVAQTIRDDSLAEKLSVASICFKENDTIHLCLALLHLHGFPCIIIQCTTSSQSLAECTSLCTCIFPSASSVGAIFPEQNAKANYNQVWKG